MDLKAALEATLRTHAVPYTHGRVATALDNLLCVIEELEPKALPERGARGDQHKDAGITPDGCEEIARAGAT